MSLKKNILKTIAGKSVLLLCSYALIIAISHYYGAAGSGFINYYYSLYAFIAIFFTAGMDTGLNYYLSSGKMSPKKIHAFATLIFISVHVLALVVILVLQLPYNSDFIPNHLLLFILFIPGITLTNIFSSLLNAEGRLFRYNIVLSVGQLILLILLFYGWYSKIIISETQFLYWLGASLYVSGLIVCGMYFMKNNTFQLAGFQQKELRLFLKLSSIFFITALLNLLLVRLDYWFVKQYCSTSDLGNYIQSARFGQIALLLPGMISFALFPDTVRKANDGTTSNITLLAKIYFYGAILFCLLFITFGKFVFPFLFGPSFNNMYIIFTLASPGIIFLSLSYPYSIYFPAVERIKILILSLVITIIFITIVYLIISPRENVYFFTIASSAGYILYCIILLLAFCRSNHVPLQKLFLINANEFKRLKNVFQLKQYFQPDGSK